MIKRILKKIDNKSGSTLVITMSMFMFLVIGTLSFWHAITIYSTTIINEEVQKQSYLSARSVVQSLTQLIHEGDVTDTSSPVAEILAKMEPPQKPYEETIWNNDLWANSGGTATIDLGVVTFADQPDDIDMGEVRVSITQLSWVEYEIAATATVNDETSTYKSTIEMNHEIEHAQIVDDVIVSTTTEHSYTTTTTTTTEFEGTTTQEPEFHIGGSFLYTDYGINYGSYAEDSNTLLDTFGGLNISAGSTVFASAEPLIFFQGENVGILGGLYSKSDMYFQGSAISNSESESELLSQSNIVLDSLQNAFNGQLIHANDTIEIRGNVGVGATELVCETLIVREGATLSAWATNSSILANTIIFEENSIHDFAGTITCNNLVMEAGATVSYWGGLKATTKTGTAMIDGVSVSGSGTLSNGKSYALSSHSSGYTIPEVDDINRFTSGWANIDENTEIIDIGSANADEYVYEGGKYYYLPDNLSLQGTSEESIIRYAINSANAVLAIAAAYENGDAEMALTSYNQAIKTTIYPLDATYAAYVVEAGGTEAAIQGDAALQSAISAATIAYNATLTGNTTALASAAATASAALDKANAALDIADVKFYNVDKNNQVVFVVRDGEDKKTWMTSTLSEGLCFLVQGTGNIEFGGTGSFNVYIEEAEEHDVISLAYDAAIQAVVDAAGPDGLVDYAQMRKDIQAVTELYMDSFGNLALPQEAIHGTVVIPFLDKADGQSGYLFGQDVVLSDEDEEALGGGSSTEGGTSTETEEETFTFEDNEWGLEPGVKEEHLEITSEKVINKYFK